MRLDSKTGLPVAYQTKLERIQQLEAILASVLSASSLEEAQIFARSGIRTDGKWRKASPLSHKALMEAAGKPKA